MANIAIYDGSADLTAVSGSTPFGLYDNDLSYLTASANTADWCARRLGYPITDIELQDEQFFACYEEAVSEYSAQVNRWNIRSNLLGAQGSATQSYTHTLIDPSLNRVIGLSRQYGTEAGSGGTIDWRTGYIQTTSGSDGWNQTYDLTTVLSASDGTTETADIEVKRVFHHASPAAEREYDPQFGAESALASFGWGGTMAGVQYLALGLTGEAGEVANKVKKLIRDGGDTPDKRKEIGKELGDVCWYLAVLAEELGSNLGKIMEDNLDKLEDRRARGVLGGSGDNR